MGSSPGGRTLLTVHGTRVRASNPWKQPIQKLEVGVEGGSCLLKMFGV